MEKKKMGWKELPDADSMPAGTSSEFKTGKSFVIPSLIDSSKESYSTDNNPTSSRFTEVNFFVPLISTNR